MPRTQVRQPRLPRPCRRLSVTLAVTAAASVATLLGPPAWAAPTDNGDQPSPCSPEQLAVGASAPEAAVGHRAVTLTFALADAAEPCTLAGYPGVDATTGGSPMQAQHTLRGYLGGLPSGVDMPPTVTLTQSQPAQAIVEGVAVDGRGNPCPTYTDLRVTAPDTAATFTVPTSIDTCQLQVHPITEVPPEPGEPA